MARYRIGNDMTIIWSVTNKDGSSFPLAGKEVHLYYTCERGRFEADIQIQDNVVAWGFAGRDQRVLGGYTLTLEIIQPGGKRIIRKDICNAFTLVGKECEEKDTPGDADINEGGEITLVSELDVYKIQPIIPTVGSNSNWFVDGTDTGKPSTGKSAYEYAKEKGYEGTESEYAESLKLAPENAEKLTELELKMGIVSDGYYINALGALKKDSAWVVIEYTLSSSVQEGDVFVWNGIKADAEKCFTFFNDNVFVSAYSATGYSRTFTIGSGEVTIGANKIKASFLKSELANAYITKNGIKLDILSNTRFDSLEPQAFYGSFKFSEIDTLFDKGIYLRDKSEEQYEPSILFVSVSPNGITQTLFESSIGKKQANIQTRAYINGVWTEWVSQVDVLEEKVTQLESQVFYGSFKFSEIDTLFDKGIYLRDKSEEQYEPSILFVSVSPNGITQTLFESSIGKKQANIQTRAYINNVWTEWVSQVEHESEIVKEFKSIGVDSLTNSLINEDDGIIIGNTLYRIYNPYGRKRDIQLKGQLHCHTNNSDGQHSPLKVCQDYESVGFDFIAITDHNYITTEPEGNNLIWMGDSYENTSLSKPEERQHICVYDVDKMVVSDDYTMYESLKSVEDILLQHAIRDNKVCNLAHPDWDKLYYPNKSLEQIVPAFSLVEVYNGSDGYSPSARAWDILLSRGARVFAISTDDYHTNELGRGWVIAGCTEKNKQAVYRALAEGNFFAIKGVNGVNAIDVTSISLNRNIINIALSDVADNISFIGQNGNVLASHSNVNNSSYAITGKERYVRVEVIRGDNMLWTQPFFVETIKLYKL